MSDIVEFVNRGASLVTPAVAKDVLRKLPFWKAEFAQINAPTFPHLVNQLEFLTDAVEDVMEGAYLDLPYSAFSQALFAITYAQRESDIIPDFVNNLGRADDSSVVRAAILQNSIAFERYAQAQNFDWEKITAKP